MTACAIETAPEGGAVRRPVFTIAADGSYAARLAGSGEAWFPERWTLDGPEPYAVPLPADQPEEPGTEVLPLTDGRVLIHRETSGRHLFSLLYPTGPATGELPLGAVEFTQGPLTLLPPAPDGTSAYALAVGPHSTALWLVAGGAFGPEHVAEVRGRCTGGVWLDGAGRMLALDRESEGGVVKSVAVDLERGGEVTPLLQIAESSNDRLLLADADSGLIVIRSDAPGEDRLGWGVLGSTRPVRFPDSLRVGDCALTPFASQPGQVLTPESCAVAVRIDRPAGSGAPSASWVGTWRPTDGRLHQLAAPNGWLTGSGLWTRDGVLRLPFVTAEVPCGVAQACVPSTEEEEASSPAHGASSAAHGASSAMDGAFSAVREEVPAPPDGRTGDTAAGWRPVPLQQATLTGRLHRIGSRPAPAWAPAPEAPDVPDVPDLPDVPQDTVPAPTPLTQVTRITPPTPAPKPPAFTSFPTSTPLPSAHAAAPEMVRMTVAIRVPVPVPTLLGGATNPLNHIRPGG